MNRKHIAKIAQNLTISERAEVAVALFVKSVELEVAQKQAKAEAHNISFWKRFDDIALEVLAQNNEKMSLLKFEAELKARRFKCPKIEDLKSHGYTVTFESFFKISL